MTGYRRLPLEGLLNCRELGGHPVPGGVTRYGVFLRSEVPARLPRADLDFLRDYGVGTVVDFRGGRELRSTPDMLASQPWVEYLHLPMYDDASAAGAPRRSGAPPAFSRDFSWEDHYIAMAEGNADWVRRVLTAMAGAKGAVLFHCTTGKDRTGVITALVLGLCGVPDADIVADYSVSQVFLRPMYRNMPHLIPGGVGADLSHPFFSTAPENMAALLGYLNEKHGGVRRYLEGCGLSGDVLARLRGKLGKDCPGRP